MPWIANAFWVRGIRSVCAKVRKEKSGNAIFASYEKGGEDFFFWSGKRRKTPSFNREEYVRFCWWKTADINGLWPMYICSQIKLNWKGFKFETKCAMIDDLLPEIATCCAKSAQINVSSNLLSHCNNSISLLYRIPGPISVLLLVFFQFRRRRHYKCLAISLEKKGSALKMELLFCWHHWQSHVCANFIENPSPSSGPKLDAETGNFAHTPQQKPLWGNESAGASLFANLQHWKWIRCSEEGGEEGEMEETNEDWTNLSGEGRAIVWFSSMPMLSCFTDCQEIVRNRESQTLFFVLHWKISDVHAFLRRNFCHPADVQ